MYVVEMLHLLVVPSCFIADKFCCFLFLQKFVRIEQNDFKKYTDYLMKNIYKKPKKAHSGTDAAQTKWLFSKQHIFETIENALVRGRRHGFFNETTATHQKITQIHLGFAADTFFLRQQRRSLDS